MAENGADFYFNPWDEGFKANPYPHYRAFHSGPPRMINLMAPIAIVGRYDDAVRILTDHETFTGVKPDVPWIKQQFEIFRGAPILQNCDPPLHSRLRRLVGRAFTPHIVAAMEPRIRQITGELLDAAAARGRFEVMGDLANPLPVMVIAEMLGIPRERYGTFKTWCDAFVAGQSAPPGMPLPAETHAANDALRDYFAAEIEQRRRHRTDDLISILIAAEEGDALSSEELLAFVVLLLIAGNETTTNLIGNGMLALGRHPRQFERVRREPSLIQTAVEEMLRFDPPIHVSLALPVVKSTVEIGGLRLEQGTIVFVLLAAANRDPARFSDPDTFDVTRHPNPHLSFGEGIHHCLGAGLARLEARVAFEMTLARFPALALANREEMPRYKGSYFFRGLSELQMAI